MPPPVVEVVSCRVCVPEVPKISPEVPQDAADRLPGLTVIPLTAHAMFAMYFAGVLLSEVWFEA